MKHSPEIRPAITSLLKTQHLAVLSTSQKDQPYASLVAFAATEDLRTILFATPRATRKFANLVANPQVAILINNTGNDPADFHLAASVTALGRAAPVAETDRGAMERLYLARHPHLEAFVKAPTCALMRTEVSVYYLVRRFQNVMELHLDL